MSRAFLAHSSKDKKSYVDIVYKILGFEQSVYDAETFEEGMGGWEEIENGLQKTDLFILFISNDSLESKWVKREINKAQKLYKKGDIIRLYPIIIDENVSYTDPRIPKWMQDTYNIKLIKRPTIAAKKIEQRLREIVWKKHPKIEEREKLFVGRNDFIKAFEERYDDLDRQKPVCYIVSGIGRVGRRAFLKHCFRKTNITSSAYRPIEIQLDAFGGIDDFIINLYGQGLSAHYDISGLSTKTIEEKIDLTFQIVASVAAAKEIIAIVDDRCIVDAKGNLSPWFDKLLSKVRTLNKTIFALISSSRLNRHLHFGNESIFAIELPELEKPERNWLLNRYLELAGKSLGKEDVKYISGLLSGFPEQIFYAVYLVEEKGVEWLKENSYEVIDFNASILSHLIDEYRANDIARGFLSLLANFDFIAYDLLNELVGDEECYINLQKEFSLKSIIHFFGTNKEYIRMNDAIKDYVQRMRIPLPSKFKGKIEQHIIKFLSTYENEEKDPADYFFSLKEALLKGNVINEKYLVPSHFLKAMKELYDRERDWKGVVKLADRVLTTTGYKDDTIIFHVRRYLCLSLARLRDRRFLDEVQKISPPDKLFLFGFYYRMTNNPEKAISYLSDYLTHRKGDTQGSTELARVLLQVGEYDKAFEIASAMYVKTRNNPYTIDILIQSIIYSQKYKNVEGGKMFSSLVAALRLINTESSDQFYFNAVAQYCLYCENDDEKALLKITEGINKYPDHWQLYFSKYHILARANNFAEMQKIIDHLQSEIREHGAHFVQLEKIRAMYHARKGSLKKAISIINDIPDMPKTAKDKIIERLLHNQRDKSLLL